MEGIVDFKGINIKERTEHERLSGKCLGTSFLGGRRNERKQGIHKFSYLV